MRRIEKRGQIGTEYLIVVGFVTFAIMTTVVLAFFYSNQTKDKIRLNQVENFANQLINSAEAVFFAGEPSKDTVKLYLPEGVENVQISGSDIIISTRTSSGVNVRAFESKVPLYGVITPGEGIKRLSLEANATHLVITDTAP